MSELKKMQVFFVRQDSAGYNAIVKMCERELTPGAVIPLSDEEFKSLMQDVVQVELNVEDNG